MTNDVRVFWDSAVSVAMTCSEQERPENLEQPEAIASYVCNVLSAAMGEEGKNVDVLPIAYPPAAKLPLLVSYKGQMYRLLWYYSAQSDEQLRCSLSDVLMELVGDCARISA